MPMFEFEDLNPDFDDVVKRDGVPLILCRWGVKKVRIGDKVFLAAKDEGDERNRLWSKPSGSSELEDLSSSYPSCIFVGGWCAPIGECKKCEAKQNGDNSWNCECVKT